MQLIKVGIVVGLKQRFNLGFEGNEQLLLLLLMLEVRPEEKLVHKV